MCLQANVFAKALKKKKGINGKAKREFSLALIVILD